MRIIILTTISLFVLFVTTAFADTIANRFGVSGRFGIAVPTNNDFVDGTSDTKNGSAWNGGFIYGFSDHIAGELEFSHLSDMDVEIGGTKAYEAKLTDYAVSVQYRFIPDKPVVPYLGIGADAINGDLRHVNGNDYDLDWAFGGHVRAGLDWFLTRGIALTADFKYTMAASGDVKNGSTKVSEYDPYWFQGTVGLRLILPEKW